MPGLPSPGTAVVGLAIVAEPDTAAVAQWMLEQLERNGYLDQYEMLSELRRWFGGSYIYTNDIGNHAIDKKVPAKFRALTANTAIWSRSELRWRKKRPGDQPGRSEP